MTAARADVERLMAVSETSANATVTLDLVARRALAGSLAVEIGLPETARHALVSGTWDATGQLLERYEDVERFAAQISYLRGFSA